MSATQDYVALEWIRGELTKTLENAQVALEAVAQTPDDTTSMRSCLTAIHQVHGTLKMVQLSGPAQMAAEMEQLAQSLMNSTVADIQLAQETLMQAILQLPAYLDRLHREQKDSERNYLPMVNNLRTVRGEERIPGSEGTSLEDRGPDLGPLGVVPTDKVTNAYFQADGEGNLPKIRARYQQSLNAILKKSKVRENLTTLGKLFTMLIRLCGESPMGNLSQLGLGVIEGVANGGIKLDNRTASLLQSVDEELKKLGDAGKNGLSAPINDPLGIGLIGLVNGAQKETKRIAGLKKLYAVEAPVPEVVAIGPDDETLSTVAKILIEELAAVTDKLDIYARSQDRNSEELVALIPNLEQISSTMVVLGKSEEQAIVAEQITAIRQLESGGEPSEETLLSMAQALLQIEASLGLLVTDTEGFGGSSFANLDEAQAAVITETRMALSTAKDAVIDFISSDFDHTKITDLPDALKALRGGLMIANQRRVGDVLQAAAHYVDQAILANKVKPGLDQMDDLADAITSVDYFLERLLENAEDPYLQMLEVAESSVAKLGYAVGEAPAVEVVEAPAAEVVEAPAAEVVEAPAAEVVEEPAEEVVEEPAAEMAVEPDEAVLEEEIAEDIGEPVREESDLIDDEILEIFVEEAEEVLENIVEFLPQWRSNLYDEEARTEVRRAFHTLKGSGRMVGATVLGDLAWSIENLINGIIENTIEASPAVMDIIAEVVARIPEGVEVFKDGHQDSFDAESMIAVAEALAEGRSPPAPAEEPSAGIEPSAEIEEPSAEITDIDLIAEDSPDTEEVEPEGIAGPEIEEQAEEPFEIDMVEDDALVIDEEEVVEEGIVEDDAIEPGDLEDDVLELEEIELDDIEIDTDLEAAQTQEDSIELDAANDSFQLDVVKESVVEEEPEEIDTEPAMILAGEEEASVAASGTEEPKDDTDLDEIFATEAEEKLQIIEQFITSRQGISELVAAFHTLKGSSAMMEINSISKISAPMEQLANDYLLQNKSIDDELLENVTESYRLIRMILQDIGTHREDVEGSQSLIDRIAAAGESSFEATFDFDDIVLLSEANIAVDAWQDVDPLIAELRLVEKQARALSQSALSALVGSMLRIYNESNIRPDDLVMSQMKRAHDHLVFMFDAIASSQAVRPADAVIGELDAIDLSSTVPDDEPEVTAETEVAVEAAEPLDSSAADEVIMLPEDNLDEDILPIFLEEAEELLEELDQSILGWTESGKPGQYLDNLLRQLHTLKGGARMAGAASLGEYAHNFETLLIGIQSNPVEFDDNFFAVLNAQQDEITRRVKIYQKVATASASQEELESLRTASNTGTGAAPSSPPVEPTEAEVPVTVPVVVSAGVDTVVELPADKIDDDVLPIFLEESDELIDELESSIQSWSESPSSLDTLDVLLRNLHTLKGGARMAGLNSLGEYAHNFETFLIGIQQKPVELDDDFFALLNQRQDEVIRRVEIYKKLSVGAATQEDLQSLQSALEPRLETDPVHSPETSVESEPESAEDQPPQAPKPASANQEMVRVSADLLEQLIGLAGESSITRGRVEQQIADFGEFLQEMEDTITRIRNQVRLLEIEAESRETLIRSRQTTESESSFDELEMDRYTMLQAISRALNEGSSDMMDLKDTLTNRSRDAEALLHQQARISGELQEGLTRTRMVPFARLIPRLRRIVRQISGEVGKSVRFDAYNVEGELDRNVLERIVAPLEHMLRNAVDHGIEEKQARVAAGKEEQGRISLRLYREGGYVVLNVSDDGAGINVDAVRAKAVERGLITEAQEISDHEVMQFIMHAGFSTAQKLTQISGRGVGMDVVDSEIKSLGGSVTIDSTFGVGTEFTIRIPFTVSINRALMVVVKDETYAVPLNTIEGIVRVSPYELEAYYQPDAPMFEYAGQPYRLAYIGKMLDKSVEHSLEGHVAPLPVILARSGDHAVALQVDRVIGSREVVVKTLGPQYGDVGGISGATLLGDGSVVIILDCMALVRSYEAGVESGEQVTIEPVAEEVRDVRTIMIVDDSVTVRKVTSRLMERQGFEVVTAKDGIDAMNQLEEIRPDVMLLDIEMPRMDGFEVLRSVRHNEQLQDLPIIMITSRTGEKHKQQAMELGVNHYLGKPFQEASLLATIEEVIEKAKAKLQPN